MRRTRRTGIETAMMQIADSTWPQRISETPESIEK